MAETFKDLPILAFKTQDAWRKWLHKNHVEHGPLWLRIFRKESGKPTVTYAEALDEALCYGWIDSQKNKLDDESFLQRFGPRGPRSLWSKVNREHIARLEKEGRLQDAGRLCVEKAKEDGRWDAAYDSHKTITVPPDFQQVLDENPKAARFFDSLNKTNRYAFLWRIQTAKKAETRAKRIEWALGLLEKGEKLH